MTEAAVGHRGAVEHRVIGRADVTAYSPFLDELADLVAQHGTLYEWASEIPQSRALRGRAPVYAALLPSSQTPVVVRHGWHGGLLAPLTADRFRRPTRAPLEMDHSARLRGAGIPTTEVLGFARYAASFGFCRVDVASRYISDAADLGMVLAGLAPGMECDAALLATQRLLGQLAAAGVRHPDLNMKNVLLRPVATRTEVSGLDRGAFSESTCPRRPAESAPLEALVIDVDVVRWTLDTPTSPRETMIANVDRLTRSFRKWRNQFGCDVSNGQMTEFARAALAMTP